MNEGKKGCKTSKSIKKFLLKNMQNNFILATTIFQISSNEIKAAEKAKGIARKSVDKGRLLFLDKDIKVYDSIFLQKFYIHFVVSIAIII